MPFDFSSSNRPEFGEVHSLTLRHQVKRFHNLNDEHNRSNWPVKLIGTVEKSSCFTSITSYTMAPREHRHAISWRNLGVGNAPGDDAIQLKLMERISNVVG